MFRTSQSVFSLPRLSLLPCQYHVTYSLNARKCKLVYAWQMLHHHINYRMWHMPNYLLCSILSSQVHVQNFACRKNSIYLEYLCRLCTVSLNDFRVRLISTEHAQNHRTCFLRQNNLCIVAPWVYRFYFV